MQATDALVARAAGAAPSQIDPAMSSAQLTVVATAQPTPPAEPRPTPRRVASATTWTLLGIVAVILALAALALVVAGMLGASI